jgi:serine protease Do
VRYAYGVTSALLLGGATLSLLTGLPAGAQVAQNDAGQISALAPRAGAPASFADLTQQLQPAVVNISTRQKVKVQGGAGANPFAGTPFEGLFGGGGGGGDGGPTTREAQSLGSGFIVSADGYVVTNNHVVTPEGQGSVVESITVTLPDGSEYPARLIGKDAASDLAVLKISAGKPLPFVKFGDSRAARVGDWVVAIGNPFGLGGTVTAGIISAVYRNIGSGGAYDRYLQTDASINQGNSGGPMFDMKGQVIGINRAIFSPSGGSVGIGFAIPAETASPIVERLIKGQAIDRGYLGVRLQPITSDYADSLGLPHNKGELIQSVEPGKGADQGGVKGGEVVLKVGGKEVTRDQTLSFLVANTPPGTRIALEVLRNGQKVNLSVLVGKRPSEEELAEQAFDRKDGGKQGIEQGATKDSDLVNKALGLSVRAVTPQIARQLGMPEDTKGLVILGVDPSSDAGSKELARRDVILSVGNRPVASVADLEAGIRAAQAAGRTAIGVQVVRPGQPPLYIGLRLR